MEKISKVVYRFTKADIKEALIKHYSIDVGDNKVELELENGREYKHHGYLTVLHED